MSKEFQSIRFKEIVLSSLGDNSSTITTELESFMPGVHILDVQSIIQPQGTISILEFGTLEPFIPKRIFFVHNVPTRQARGFHAHKNCAQLLISAQGVCVLEVIREGKKLNVTMDSSTKAVLLPKMTWASQTYLTSDSLLIVLASHPYDALDYIQDFQEFLSLEGEC
jgi:hypothetical protein